MGFTEGAAVGLDGETVGALVFPVGALVGSLEATG